MDTLFLLGQESRLRFLQQAAARVPGCAYLCVWAPVPAGGRPLHPSSSSPAAASGGHLVCLDAWLRGGGDGDGRVRALFDAYRGSLCAAVSGCVPGWAYKDGRAYMELPGYDLTALASLPAQQLFYQEAGIKTAAFLGCESGEVEVGMAAAGERMSLQASVEQVFSEDFFQQSLLEELLQLPPTGPSSSSSSLPSASVGSPADGGSTSLLRTMAMSSSTTPSPRELTTAPPALLRPHPPPQTHPVPTFGVHRPHGHLHFPSAEADDAAMAQAMLAVISGSAASPPALPTPSTPPAANHRSQQRSPRRGSGSTTAFRAYNSALAPRAARRSPGSPGQRMIKMGFSILRRIHTIRYSQERAAAASQVAHEEDDDAMETPAPAPSSSQLHHMISERRRRERLNESFDTLRELLPPGSKKDKATVLAKTLDYMHLLIAQVSELEARNRSLEAQLHQRFNVAATGIEAPWLVAGGSPERVHVQVSSSGAAGASTSSSLPQEVMVRVATRAECDLSELVIRVMATLRETGRFTVVSVDARQPAGGGNGVTQASITLRAKGGELELEEASLREALRKAVEGLVTPPPEEP